MIVEIPRPNRRAFCRVLLASATGCYASGGDDSPAGSINIRGPKATFSVDYPRPLESVAYTFIRQYGWKVTFEEAPLVYSGDIVDVTRNFSLGTRSFNPRGGQLRFSYDAGPNGQPTRRPEEVLRTAINAYHDAGFPGRYDLISADGFMHIVPIARANEEGTMEVIRSPLDAIITVDNAQRTPESVFENFVREVEAVSGYRVLLGRGLFPPGSQPQIEPRFDNVQARAVLRSLIQASGRARIWYLMYGIRQKAYALSVVPL